MRIEDYPSQEPLSDMSRAFLNECLRLSHGINGVEHAYGEHPCQRVMVFPASNPNGATLVFMHGGGWTNGFKEQLAFMAPPLNEAGITFVSSGYRLAPAFTFPVGWLDAASAVRWTYENCARFGGDPSRIFVGGHSAGAHYAALLAVREDWIKDFKLPSSPIRGCLPISGIYDFTEGCGLAMRPRFLGPVEEDNEIAASPMHNLQTVPPPMLLAHGSEDFPHLMKQASKMEECLRRKGGYVRRLELKGCNHFGGVLSAAQSDTTWLIQALQFMKQTPAG